jgi:hypothetical protein
MLIFIYLTLEFKICPHCKLRKFPTAKFRGMFFYIYILDILEDIRLLDLHVGAAFVVLIQPSEKFSFEFRGVC